MFRRHAGGRDGARARHHAPAIGDCFPPPIRSWSRETNSVAFFAFAEMVGGRNSVTWAVLVAAALLAAAVVPTTTGTAKVNYSRYKVFRIRPAAVKREWLTEKLDNLGEYKSNFANESVRGAIHGPPGWDKSRGQRRRHLCCRLALVNRSVTNLSMLSISFLHARGRRCLAAPLLFALKLKCLVPGVDFWTDPTAAGKSFIDLMVSPIHLRNVSNLLIFNGIPGEVSLCKSIE